MLTLASAPTRQGPHPTALLARIHASSPTWLSDYSSGSSCTAQLHMFAIARPLAWAVRRPRPSAAKRLRRQATTRPGPAAASSPSSPSLAHLPVEIRAEVSRAMELAERASTSWTVTHSDFLSPPAAGAALAALAGRADVAALPWGGWPGAERVRLVLGQPDRLADVLGGSVAAERVVVLPDEDGSSSGSSSSPSTSTATRAPPPALADPTIGGVAALALRGRFTFEAASHRDFLGAVLNGAGLDRRVIGDILLDGERGATLFVAPGVVAAVETGVTAVRGVGVVVSQVDPADIRLPDPPAPPTPVQSTEASLRLDAVASAGFRTSRAKMASLIRSGGVRLNWAPTTKGSAVVSAGDIIACSGKGRVEVVGVGLTAKGRWRVEMLRFV